MNVICKCASNTCTYIKIPVLVTSPLLTHICSSCPHISVWLTSKEIRLTCFHIVLPLAYTHGLACGLTQYTEFLMSFLNRIILFYKHCHINYMLRTYRVIWMVTQLALLQRWTKVFMQCGHLMYTHSAGDENICEHQNVSNVSEYETKCQWHTFVGNWILCTCFTANMFIF